MLILKEKEVPGLRSLIMQKKLNKLPVKMEGALISILGRARLRTQTFTREY